MTREKALQASSLLYKIETYEALLTEIYSMELLEEIKDTYTDGADLEKELVSVVQTRLDALKKELEEM